MYYGATSNGIKPQTATEQSAAPDRLQSRSFLASFGRRVNSVVMWLHMLCRKLKHMDKRHENWVAILGKGQPVREQLVRIDRSPEIEDKMEAT
jgi:hypothetical protein